MQRNRLRKLTTLMAAATMVSSIVTAQTKNEFSVKQAVDYGLKNSVQVKNALLGILIQQQTNRDITSIALPQINGSVSGTHNFDIAVQKIPNFIAPATYQVLIDKGVKDGNGQPIGFPNGGDFGNLLFPLGNAWNASAGVTLNQIVFDGQVFIALKARNGTIELSKKQLELTEENIKANIYKISYQLITGKRQIELLDANIDRLQKLQHDIKVMYENGFTEKIDIDKLTVQISNLETEKLRANNMIRNGYSGLKVLLGMPVKDTLVLTDTLSDEQIKEGVLEISQMNYSDRKDYQALEITNKLNALNVRRYKLSQLPTLGLNGSYGKQAQRDKFDFFGKGDWFTSSYLGLQLRVPIFNGFSLRAKTEKARLELQQTKNQTEALKISIDNDIESARNNFANAIATMDYQKKNMALAEVVYNQTKKKYEIGTGSATDINTAQTDLKTAQTNYIMALYDAIIAKVDYQKATGKL